MGKHNPQNFNPRSPRGGATTTTFTQSAYKVHFNPRSPRGGATHIEQQAAGKTGISIHAPHEGERQKR